MQAPLLLNNSWLRCFWLHADKARIERLCEQHFSRPSHGAVTVRPLSDGVALIFAKIGRASQQEDESLYSPEQDVAFWIPVRVETPKETFFAWYLPYVFVDHPFAMATGRELFGFPKSMGSFSYPAKPNEEGSYTLDTWHARRNASRVEQSRLLTLSPTKEAPLGGLRSMLTSSSFLVDGLESVLSQMGDVARTQSISLLFIRQLRDVEDPARAAFQEIVVARCAVTSLPSVTPIKHRFALKIEPSVSHPLAEELGLSANVTSVASAFHVDFDFTMERGRTLWRAQENHQAKIRPQKKRKVAVLGGGIGALSAVCAMTATPELREKYEITVYQMGWRLGGKGASSRNTKQWGRIEEHGLHLWFGFYEHAFRMIRGVYSELNRAPGAPLATFEDAFLPHDRAVFHEEINGQYKRWILDYPRNTRRPGDPSPEKTPAELVKLLLHWMQAALQLAIIPTTNKKESRLLAACKQLLFGFSALAGLSLEKSFTSQRADALRALLRKALQWATTEDDERRRLLLVLELALTVVVGIRADRLSERGFSSIDGEDLKDWLARHGASRDVLEAAPLRSIYDMIFAYHNGERGRPSLAAGTALKVLSLMFFDYSGAFLWKMNGGMGEVVFSPIYEVLRARGVRFAFFHKVRSLGLNATKDEVSRISLVQQATPKKDEYSPLLSVDGVPCWPSEPDWSQLKEGDSLRGQNLEASDGIGHHLELRQGRDFDAVILGIPLGALQPVCQELTAAHPKWREMLRHISTTATASCQAWLKPRVEETGWGDVQPSIGPVLGGFTGTFDTWADMTHTASHEAWPSGSQPSHVAYFCAPLSEPEAPERGEASARLAEKTQRMFEGELRSLWPSLYDERGFRWESFVDPEGREGTERLRAQYIRANVEPSERYVQSLAGSTRYRIRPDESGVKNLFLAGDWTDNGINIGCIEAAVRSGEQCAAGLYQLDTQESAHNSREKREHDNTTRDNNLNPSLGDRAGAM